jgi:hypothetical protein
MEFSRAVAHVGISTPFDISTRDFRQKGTRVKILVVLN